jgi:hypothetical protein
MVWEWHSIYTSSVINCLLLYIYIFPHNSDDLPPESILCESEAIAYLRFRQLGHYFMEPGDYQDAPIRVSKILHFIRSVGLLDGWNRGGCTIDLERSQCKGWFRTTPYSFFHSFHLSLPLVTVWCIVATEIWKGFKLYSKSCHLQRYCSVRSQHRMRELYWLDWQQLIGHAGCKWQTLFSVNKIIPIGWG